MVKSEGLLNPYIDRQLSAPLVIMKKVNATPLILRKGMGRMEIACVFIEGYNDGGAKLNKSPFEENTPSETETAGFAGWTITPSKVLGDFVRPEKWSVVESSDLDVCICCNKSFKNRK